MTQEQQTDTSCKECIFAEYEGITQTGCELHKIQLFQSNDVEVIEAYDEEKEFFVIKNKRCMWYRPEHWTFADRPKLDKVVQLAKENEMQYQAIIIAGDSLTDIYATLNSLDDQILRPKHITVIEPFGIHHNPRHLKEALDSAGVKWRIESIVNPETPPGLHIDFVLDVVPYTYYAVFHAGFIVPSDTFRTLNLKIVTDLYPLTILKPNSTDNGLVALTSLHKIFQGHQNIGLVEKVEAELTPEQSLKSITDLCPSFPL